MIDANLSDIAIFLLLLPGILKSGERNADDNYRMSLVRHNLIGQHNLTSWLWLVGGQARIYLTQGVLTLR